MEKGPSASGSCSTSITDDTTFISRDGIKLSYLLKWLKNQSIDSELTTAQVCKEYFQKYTEEQKSSFCEMIKRTECSVVGKAQVFVSHAWPSKFVDLMNTLKQYFKDERDIMVWIDIVSYNQHKTHHKDFAWWSETFKAAIKDIGRTVMVLAPWQDPKPLTRGWCIWELYCTIETKCDFGVAISAKGEQELIQMIDKDGATNVVNKMLAKINCSELECCNPEDKEQIYDAIKQTVGFSNLKSKILLKMKQWSLEQYRKKAEAASKRLGRLHAHTLRSMDILATLYKNQSNYKNAEKLCKENLEIWDWILKNTPKMKDHPDAIKSLNNLASCYDKTGRYPLAEKLYLECIERRESLLGDDHVDTLSSMSDLALCLRNLGKYELAEEFLCKCFEKMKKVLGDRHRETLFAMNNLGSFYRSLGKLEKAKDLLEKCFEIRKEEFGIDHPDTLMSLTNLAILYFDLGKYKEAETRFDEALKRRISIGEAEYPATARLKMYFGLLHYRQGKYASAEEMYKEAVAILESTLGRNHSDTLMCLSYLARLWTAQCKYEPALELYEECFKERRSSLGDNHPNTLLSMINLAFVYSNQGKLELAENLYDKSFEKMNSALGCDHPETLTAMNARAFLYSKQGKYEVAESLYVEVLEKRKLLLGDDHPETLSSMRNLELLRARPIVTSSKWIVWLSGVIFGTVILIYFH